MDAKDRKLLEDLLEAHLRRVDARCATTEARLAELRRDLLGSPREIRDELSRVERAFARLGVEMQARAEIAKRVGSEHFANATCEATHRGIELAAAWILEGKDETNWFVFERDGKLPT